MCTGIMRGCASKAVGMESTSGFSSGKLLGYHYTQTTIQASEQTRSSSTNYIYRAMDKALETLKVYTQTMAKKVVFDANKRATGVQVESLEIKYDMHARKEVILSAGVFQSPQLLMVSGVEPRETLEGLDIDVVSDLPGTGQNMWVSYPAANLPLQICPPLIIKRTTSCSARPTKPCSTR